MQQIALVRFIRFLFAAVFLFFAGPSAAEDSFTGVIRRAEKRFPGLKAGFIFTSLGTGQTISSYRDQELFIPASVQKLFVTYTALKKLGTDFAFPTEVYVERLPAEKSGDVGALTIVGHGDPAMVEERLYALSEQLYRLGVRSARLVIDSSLFITPPKRQGINPYEGGLSAVPLNFNSIVFDVAPGRVGESAIASPIRGVAVPFQNEIRTENGSLFQASLSGAGDGYRLSGRIGASASPRALYASVAAPEQYFADVLRAALLRSGIKVEQQTAFSQPPPRSIPFLTLTSKELPFILADLNRFSNNFIAGQLVFALGRNSSGSYDQKLGLERITSELHSIGVGSEEVVLADGSGLSRSNRATAHALVQVLQAAASDFALFPDFSASLSRAGRTGTLKSRRFAGGEVWGKTGTLDGVSSLAGYFSDRRGRRRAFAILLNGIPKADAMELEDALVRAALGGKERE